MKKPSDTDILKLFQSCYFLSKENLPVLKGLWLIEFLKFMWINFSNNPNKYYPGLRDIISIISDSIETKIITDLQQFKFFSDLIDESMDVGKIDHLILIVYYMTNKIELKNTFIKNIDISEKNAQYIFTVLKAF